MFELLKDICIQPAPGDAGGALGASLVTWHQYYNKDTRPIMHMDRPF